MASGPETGLLGNETQRQLICCEKRLDPLEAHLSGVTADCRACRCLEAPHKMANADPATFRYLVGQIVPLCMALASMNSVIA
jgi:hypothetical protein